MTIKSLLFILFLYVCLVWVGAAYLHSGAAIQEFGLRWTAVGLISLLVLLAVGRVVHWWRLWRARVAARPAAPARTQTVVHEDDAALAALIAEANAVLAKSPAYAVRRGAAPLRRLPWYLLVGPEASGKTSTFVNSGIEPQLLAGQVSGTASVIPTRLCNIWLAENSIFVEISGRVFSSDIARWMHLLEELSGRKSRIPFWRRVWSEPEQRLDIRAVVAFSDVKEFIDAPADHQRYERYSRKWQEQLRAISDVFGIEVPVYQVITKCDAIPFFPDFFRRLPETEATQVLGCTLPFYQLHPSDSNDVPAETEAKRLTGTFRALYHALAARRLTHLAQEPNGARRPAIYEFPRELKRIRTSLVQFLTDVFRRHPLKPGPLLCGYYLTGIREVEAAAGSPAVARAEWTTVQSAMDTTRLFGSPDATRATSPENVIRASRSSKGLVPRWMFVADLFHRIVSADHSPRPAVLADSRFEFYRQAVFAGVCVVCFLLCLAFFSSWIGNIALLQDVDAAVSVDIRPRGDVATVSDLQSLEALRLQVERLRSRGAWSLHWGLYSGDRVLEGARAAYFRTFRAVLLNDLNAKIVEHLAALPQTPGADAPYDPAYRMLKTHLIISSGVCQLEPELVSQVLRERSTEINPTAGSRWQMLADRQIEFYASELDYGNPSRLPEDTGARTNAQQYLRNVKGIDRIYRSILDRSDKTVLKPKRLSEVAPNYAKVLKGQEDVAGVFTEEGWKYLEKASREPNAAAFGEECVVGERTTSSDAGSQDSSVAQSIQKLFIRDYMEAWKKFVAGFSVLPYNSSAEAAQNLEILSGYKSPLLALFAMTANQTNFAATPVEPGTVEKGVARELLKKFEAVAQGVGSRKEVTEVFSGPVDITRSFQPVHWVVPPGSETWVAEKNKPYVDALAELRRSMQEISQSRNADPAAYEQVSRQAGQNYEKALEAVRQIAAGFKPVGVVGLDAEVKRLLEEPIRLTKGFIPNAVDIPKITEQKMNGELNALCARLRPTLQKYPFQRSSPNDASLEELAGWFAPGRGGIWKFGPLPDLAVKDSAQWRSKDPAAKPQITGELLTFLNRAQAIADVFFPGGTTRQLNYTLRPKLDPSFKDSILELEIDGQVQSWSSPLQKQFSWPAPPDARVIGGAARIRTGNVTYAFAQRGGVWGIFRIIGQAEPRAFNSTLVEWKYSQLGDQIRPAPVQIEIVEFPGGVDLFHPTFFEGLRCPAKAVQ